MDSRLVACRILTEVTHKRCSLTPEIFHRHEVTEPLVQELCYGVLRWYFRLEAIANIFLKKRLSEKDQDIHFLILLGLYQLDHLSIPPHAVINETVQASRKITKHWACSLINAILRRYQREKETIAKNLAHNLEFLYAHPAWFIHQLQAAWPQQWQSILATHNQRPTMCLRVNLQETSRDLYLERLAENNIEALGSEISPSAIILEQPCNVKKLPGFKEGLVSVQDCGAQLAASLLEVQANQVILDACAAPGGKTVHLLEYQPQLKELVALDLNAERLGKVQQNLQRANQQATLIIGDGTQPKSWKRITNNEPFPSRHYDRILLDAPCSGTGVINHHPDIKLLRRSSDIQKFAKQQRDLLNTLWTMLKPGGILLYVTCSILPEENSQQIEAFLQQHSDAKEIPLNLQLPEVETRHGKQLLPTLHQYDGFYYAKLLKTS